jgi:septal ring factor EnvC (AmiA/AmiB activator)
MTKNIRKLNYISFVFLCVFSINQHAFARDISNEQHAVTEARQEQHAAKSNLEENRKQIAAQEKRVTEEQDRLTALKQAQKAAQTRLDNANTQLERHLNILEKAWPERNR